MIYHCQCGATVYYGENTKPVCMDCRNNVCGSRATKLPLWVRAIRRLRTPEDRGVGDTVARIAAKFGGEKFKRFSQRIGIPCGCTRKQAEWNERWPY